MRDVGGLKLQVEGLDPAAARWRANQGPHGEHDSGGANGDIREPCVIGVKVSSPMVRLESLDADPLDRTGLWVRSLRV